MGYFTHVFKWGIPLGFFHPLNPITISPRFGTHLAKLEHPPIWLRSTRLWKVPVVLAPHKSEGNFSNVKKWVGRCGFSLCFSKQNHGQRNKKLQEKLQERRTINKTHQNNLTRSSYHQKSNFQDLKPVFYNKHVCPKRRSNMNQ